MNIYIYICNCIGFYMYQTRLCLMKQKARWNAPSRRFNCYKWLIIITDKHRFLIVDFMANIGGADSFLLNFLEKKYPLFVMVKNRDSLCLSRNCTFLVLNSVLLSYLIVVVFTIMQNLYLWTICWAHFCVCRFQGTNMNAFKAFKASVPIAWSPHLYITLVRGIPGTRRLHRRTLEALRLRKCNRTVMRWNTPTVRGMLLQVRH